MRNQVYATDAEDGVPPSFELIEASDYWEVPIEGHGPPENPVPGEPSMLSVVLTATRALTQAGLKSGQAQAQARSPLGAWSPLQASSTSPFGESLH